MKGHFLIAKATPPSSRAALNWRDARQWLFMPRVHGEKVPNLRLESLEFTSSKIIFKTVGHRIYTSASYIYIR